MNPVLKLILLRLVTFCLIHRILGIMESKRIARYIIKLLGTAVAVWVASWIMRGIQVENIWWAMLVSFILGLLNTFIKPFLQLISFPFIIFSFGFFLLVINAILLLAASEFVPDHHFQVNGFWAAFWGSIIISIVSWILEPRDKDKNSSGSGVNMNVRVGNRSGS
jgi:putative membrane protein